MKFTIIDDDSNFCVQLKYDLFIYFQDYVEIEDIEIVLDDFYKVNLEGVNVVFIDIDLRGFDGLKLSEQVRQLYPNILIIFSSFHEEMIFNTLGVVPFQFIRKNQYSKDKNKVFKQLKVTLDRHYKNFIFMIKGRQVKINISEVIYCISLGHEMIIHTEHEEFVVSKSIIEILGLFNSNRFIQIQRNTIINLMYAKSVAKKNVTLLTNQQFNVGRKYQNLLINQYQEYLLKS